MNIYVGNLAYSVTEENLREAFSRYGAVTRVNLISDKLSGQSKGFAFVEMADNNAAEAAIKGLNDTALKGRNIKVNQAKPREAGGPGGGGGRDRDRDGGRDSRPPRSYGPR